eukprot:6374557-Alexandrium_andersonii.AAC.1
MQHGPPGSGKSIGVWFQTQVWHTWQKIAEGRDVHAWQEKRAAHDSWRDLAAAKQHESVRKDDPGPQPVIDFMFRNGSMAGLT